MPDYCRANGCPFCTRVKVALVTLAISVLTLLGLIGGYLRWVRPRVHKAARQVVAVRDSILGREAYMDSITGREIEPALPGVGVRLAAQEVQMTALTTAVTKVAESQARLENHEERISALEAGAYERIANKAESVAAFQAIEAALHANPEEDQ